MAKKHPPVWELEAHTAAKHKLLTTYLARWVPIFQQGYGATDHLVFIDGFAGPGIYTGGEPGSPIWMLKTHQAAHTRPISHLHCWFVEKNPESYAILEHEVERWRTSRPGEPERHFELRCGEYEDYFDEINAYIDRLPNAAVFAFLDPFGTKGNDPDLAGKLALRRRSEALIFLPVERFAGLAMGKTTPAIEATMNTIFGDDRWLRLREFNNKAQCTEAFIDMFKSRLAEGAERGQRFYVESFVVRPVSNDANCLFFVTKHVAAVDAMREAMWAVDPAEGREFAAGRPPTQNMLWPRALADAIAEHFPAGTDADFEKDIWRYVIDEQSPYGKKQTRRALELLRDTDGRLVAIDRKSGKAHRRGFPADKTICRFIA